MTYPTRPWWTPVRLEMAFGTDPASDPAAWEWTDVTADLDRTQPLTITRGRPDESGQTQPARVSPRLVNNHSHYTPGHPASPHYPHVRQGVPARISVQAGGSHLRVPNADGAGARAAGSAALDVSGDLDVRVEMALDRAPAQWGSDPPATYTAWAHGPQQIIGRYNLAGARMWRVLISESGAVRLGWSPDGTALIEALSTEAIPYPSGSRFALRAVLDVDNGASGWTAQFYVAPALSTGVWRALGHEVSGTGTTSINTAGTAALELGNLATLGFLPGAGRYYRAELRDGIDGPPLAGPDFTASPPGASTVTDPQGNTWAVVGSAEVTDWRIRMTGEVADWAPTWPWGDLSNPARPGDRPGEARCDITIAGPLRRLGQGQKALASTLRRRIPSYGPVAYWPMEEDRAATWAYSPIDGVAPMMTSGLQFAAVDTLDGSSPLPAVTDGATLSGIVPAPSDPSATGWHTEFVASIPRPPETERTVMRYRSSGTVAEWWLRLGPTSARVIGYNLDGGTVVSQGATIGPDLHDGRWNRWQFRASQSGGTVSWVMVWWHVGTGGGQMSGTYPGSAGRITSVLSAPEWHAELAGMALGHIAVFAPQRLTAYQAADDGFAGETALARMRRLAEEEQLPMSVLGVASESPAMGPQRPAALLTLLQECADVDGGVLAERREVPGIAYRPRQVLYNQTPGVQLSARSNEIDNPFTPVLDDQRLRNDITASRTGGSSARAVDDQSVAEVGLYDEAVTVNVAEDGQLADIAAWRLHRGTWPGMRYPAVTSALDVAPSVIDPWMDRLEGDRIQVTDLPPQHPDETVDLMVEGLTETLTPTRWSIEAAASPGGPWRVGEIPPDEDDPDVPTHVDTDGTVLVVDTDESTTTLYLRTTDGPEWVTTGGPDGGDAAPGDLPVDLSVAGEIVRCERIEPLAWDIYDRTVTGGWGDTTTGVAWTSSGGPTSDRSVANGQGIITLSSPTTQRFEVLPFGLSDCQLLVTITPSAVATGSALTAGVVMRVSGSAYYRIRVLLGTEGTIGMDAARVTTAIGSTAPTPYTYVGGSALHLRARVDGDRLRARVWPAGVLEPDVWWLDRTVETDPVPVGVVGVVASAESGNTNVSPQLAFSSWQVVNPQYAEVTRSVNGITRAHPAGTDVRLAHPMIVAL
ncbi:hypothetical protein [Streptomyces sp. NBRC 109706]|uniref:hypothetical protein n=1 Tax=Streptomyces sp. NBRC 109706 TaxID=1550035 RepID=UPI0007824892|nr:hypothetical protein [Streptomyces sp. NBRC 109706]